MRATPIDILTEQIEYIVMKQQTKLNSLFLLWDTLIEACPRTKGYFCYEYQGDYFPLIQINDENLWENIKKEHRIVLHEIIPPKSEIISAVIYPNAELTLTIILQDNYFGIPLIDMTPGKKIYSLYLYVLLFPQKSIPVTICEIEKQNTKKVGYWKTYKAPPIPIEKIDRLIFLLEQIREKP